MSERNSVLGRHISGGVRGLSDHAGAEAGSGVKRERGRLRPVREVLVVDDDRDAREVLRDLLAERGFAVHTAENGRAALEWLEARQVPPACIILDLEMPVMNGWDFMQWLRRRDDVTPVVVVSGAANPPEGAILYFSKPPHFGALLQAVATCCGVD